MLFAPRFRRAPSEKAVIRFCWWLYLLLSRILTVSLPPSACSNPLCRHPPLPPRRSPLVLRLFALALADGSGLPFSLHPPPAALESQTPQREARALPRRARNLQRCKPRLSLPGRAALIRHGAAQRRTVPPSPRGRLSAPSHSVSTREPRSALHLPQCAQGS